MGMIPSLTSIITSIINRLFFQKYTSLAWYPSRTVILVVMPAFLPTTPPRHVLGMFLKSRVAGGNKNRYKMMHLPRFNSFTARYTSGLLLIFIILSVVVCAHGDALHSGVGIDKATQTGQLTTAAQGQLVALVNDDQGAPAHPNEVAGIDKAANDLQDYSAGVQLLSSASNDIAELLADMESITSGNALDGSDALRLSSNIIALAKDRIVDLQISPLIPIDIQRALKSAATQLTSAEKQLNKIGGIISQYHEPSVKHTTGANHHRTLGSKGFSPVKQHFKPRRLSKADYHIRTKKHHSSLGYHQSSGQGLGSHFEHQQGFRRARSPRERGAMNRRLSTEENKCVDVPVAERKQEQCFRLAECAKNYNLYDMFVYSFGDDINFDTGVVDTTITTFDEAEIRLKHAEITGLSEVILQKYDDDGLLLDSADPDFILMDLNGNRQCDEGGVVACGCDRLLQEFHRFDEGLSVQGKWAGGSVTSVCRGWGTSRFISLESIFAISQVALNNDPVDVCVRTALDEFNDIPNYVDDSPDWCSAGDESSDGTLCCDPSDSCDECGSTGNIWIGGQCFDSSDSVQANIGNETACCADGCAVQGCRVIDFQSKDDCETTTQVDCTIVPNAKIAVAPPDNICGDVVDDLEFEGIWATSFFADILDDFLKDLVKTNIQETFKCLYYSNYVIGEGEQCSSLVGTQKTDCTTACDLITDAAFDIQPDENGLYQKITIDGEEYYDYLVNPAILPRQEVRKTFFQLLLDFYKLDTSQVLVGNAAEFIIDIFQDFMGCASDLVENLLQKDSENFLFGGTAGANPYAPGGNTQFQLPLSLNDATAVDEHGQIKEDSTSLDDVFNYVSVGDGSGIDNSGATPMFSTALKELFISQYILAEDLAALLETYEECEDDKDADKADACTSMANSVRALLTAVSNQGFERSQLDDSIALIFGNSTTIGQVCAYSRGLEQETVDDLPGFCCLDAPYENTDWGEAYSCLKYENAADGSTRAVQKSKADCTRRGPVPSGFNQEACDIYQGTWCPNPRNCFKLSQCVNDLLVEVEESNSRMVFFEYLDGAPKLEDINGETEDPEKCGDLREYFEYDRDYPDDDRICEEIRDLQCLTDFSNLDAFAQGVAGAGGGEVEQLAISDTLFEIEAEEYDEASAKAWRTANFALLQTFEAAELILTTVLQPAAKACAAVVLGVTFPCYPVFVASEGIQQLVIGLIKIAISISEHFYSEIATPSNVENLSGFERDRQDSMYNNIITNFNNIITTFKATQQLKTMLGEIAEGLDEETDGRRRLQESCYNTTENGFGCPELATPIPSCEDISRLCDRSYNYPYIAYQSQAGCDQLDSDGNGVKDECEDRYPPSILLRNAEIFRCDDDDTSRLCYNDKVFKNEKQLLNFLHYQLPATDDCTISPSELSVDISHTGGSCYDTVYTITPVQDLPQCEGYNPGPPLNETFENPLLGTQRQVTVRLDAVAPSVECGFYDNGDKTLYHYMSSSDEDQPRLVNARFWYKINDNCNADVEVDVVVRSNEIQQNIAASAELIRSKRIGFEEQVQFLYAPSHCDSSKGTAGFCQNDYSMGGLKTRYYEVTVTATDSAGHVGVDTCRVAIVPTNGTSHHATQDVDASVDQSQVLYDVTSTTLLWDTELSPPMPEANLVPGDEQTDLRVGVVDNDPPEVDCFIATQNLCGLGGFTDLLFSYTAADVDDCTAVEDLEMSIEILSNEVVETGKEMVLISHPISGSGSVPVPSIYAEDSICGTCKISSFPKSTRKYVVVVTATDRAGNVGTAMCSTEVGDGVIDETEDPLFLLQKTEFTGGQEVHLPYNVTRDCLKKGKFYVDYPQNGIEFKCAQDCDPTHGLPCKGPPPDRSGVPAALFDTAAECCRNKVFWIDEDTCVTDTNGWVPSPPAGSADWYVNWEVNFGTCVQDCVGPPPCGGLRSNYEPPFKNAEHCCSSIPWKDAEICRLR